MLLLQPQAAALIGAVVGIKHLGESFRAHLFFHGAVVIANVEGIEIKGFGGGGSPEPQPVAGIYLVAQHRHVVGGADGVFRRNPAGAVVTVLIGVALAMAAKTHKHRLVGITQFPRPAPLQPLVGDFHLPAIANQLVENPKLITNAIAHGRHLKAGQGFHVAGGQAAEAAIAQPRLLLHLK